MFQIRRNAENSHTESHGAVDLLVVIMGLFSLLYWLFRATVIGYWASSHKHIFDDYQINYLIWNCSKYSLKILSTGFLVFMFTNVARHVHVLEEVYQNERIHILLPAFFLTIVASYFNSIIATYNGEIEKQLSTITSSIGFNILYQAGGPVHLGFCLHVSVHFGYIFKAMCAGLVREQQREGENQEETASLIS